MHLCKDVHSGRQISVIFPTAGLISLSQRDPVNQLLHAGGGMCLVAEKRKEGGITMALDSVNASKWVGCGFCALAPRVSTLVHVANTHYHRWQQISKFLSKNITPWNAFAGIQMLGVHMCDTAIYGVRSWYCALTGSSYSFRQRRVFPRPA